MWGRDTARRALGRCEKSRPAYGRGLSCIEPVRISGLSSTELGEDHSVAVCACAALTTA